MTSATNLAALELPEPPVRPHLTLLDGRVKESVLIGRALAGGPRGRAAEEEVSHSPPERTAPVIRIRALAAGGII